MTLRALVLLFVLILVPSLSFAAEGTLYLNPARGTYTIGDVFEVEVRADTDGVQANAAEADLTFNPASLSVVNISTEGSALSFWPTPPEYSNTKGTIRFSGTAAGSFQKKDATLIKIQFKAESTNPGDVQIASGALLLNDARATNIIATMRSGLYTLVARQEAPAKEADATSTPASSEPVPEVKGVSIQVPAISGYDDRVSIGGRIILQGSASPNTKLAIFLQHDEETPFESSVLTTSDGSFTYVSSQPAIEGMYRAWAEVKTPTETLSSDKVTIAVRSDGFAAAAESVGSILSFALPYLLLLIAVGVSLGYWYNRKAAADTH